ncbi:hypothetical protein ACFW1A_00840 [Kitasatospora sp. NPDC058965]|uniref:hypothetical protein n=1 Tax=Kitasatospora sp. NPDC058965 TaxID=3346682 RepID=UPI0036D0CBBF
MTPATAATPAATAVRAHRDSSGHPALGGARVTHISVTLHEALLSLAAQLDPAAAIADPESAVSEALRLVAAAAYDTAEPGEAPGLLYVTPSVTQLGSRPVWLERSQSDGPITARFPADRC